MEIIKLYKELSGEIITIGSDAHNTEDVGSGHFLTIKMLKFLVFGYISKYENLQE